MLTGCGAETVRRSIAATPIGAETGFSPERIVVNQEDKVVLRVGNGTTREHGFAIEGYRITRVVRPNETLQVRFRASRAGTFRIYCQLHQAHLSATLVVQ